MCVCVFQLRTWKSVQNHLVSGVLGVLSSFGSSNTILALPSVPTEPIVPAGYPDVKSSHSLHLNFFSFKMLLLMSF